MAILPMQITWSFWKVLLPEPLQEGRGILPLSLYIIVFACNLIVSGNSSYLISIMPVYDFWTVLLPESRQEGRDILPLPKYISVFV